MPLVAPSVVASDWARFGEALEVMKAAGASMVHVDVMDGHFVPEISVGLPVVASLRRATALAIDVHLLVERPERFLKDFIAAGADWVSFHLEATVHGRRVLEQIRAEGAKAGLAASPAAPLETISELWSEIDFLNVLTAEAGIPEGKFIPATVEKLVAASKIREERHLNFALSAEGGLGPAHLEEIAGTGVDILVAGSAIFNDEDPRTRLTELVRNAARIHRTSVV